MNSRIELYKGSTSTWAYILFQDSTQGQFLNGVHLRGIKMLNFLRSVAECFFTFYRICQWFAKFETNILFSPNIWIILFLIKENKKEIIILWDLIFFKGFGWQLLILKADDLRNVRGAYDKFPDFFRMGIYICRRLLKIPYVIAIHLKRWLTNFYDFRFKSTATAAIGIHPTKSWLSQLVNFKNAIWHFRRRICNKILFKTWKKCCHRNVWNGSDCFWSILHESSFWVA